MKEILRYFKEQMKQSHDYKILRSKAIAFPVGWALAHAVF